MRFSVLFILHHWCFHQIKRYQIEGMTLKLFARKSWLCKFQLKNNSENKSRWKSTAVSWNYLFNLLTFCAYDLCVFATVHTAWKTAQETGEPEETESPKDSNASDFLSDHLSSVGSAELTVGSVISAAIDLNDGWALLRLHHWLSVHGLHWWHHGLSIHWLLHRLSIHWLHWLSVHFLCLKLILLMFMININILGFNHPFLVHL